MITTRQSISQVREYIGLPENGKPNNASILARMNNESNTMLAELGITRDNESFKIKELFIPPFQTTLNVSASNFGKPFLVETYDGGADPLYVPNEVTVTPVQERDKFRNTDSFTLSFFHDASVAKVIVTPPQEQSSWVKIYYEVESYVLTFGEMAVPLRDAYMHLLVIRTARAAMPLTGHDETTYGRLMDFINAKQYGPDGRSGLEGLWTQQRFNQSAHAADRSYFGADREGYNELFWIG